MAALLLAGAAQAGSVAENFCGRQTPLSAAQQDRLLQLAAVVRAELEAAGTPVALVARSGLNLARFGQRFSHAGLALAEGAGSPWAVRQLYYACEEGRPRLFDQGLAGFVSGLDDPAAGHVSVLLLPPAPARVLAAAALDRQRALRLVAATYSANAHAWSLRYQNCNQWLAELMAAGFGGLPDGPELRRDAQAWLRNAGYQPSAVDAGSHALMFAAGFVPWLRLDDRPEEQRHSLVFQVSLPASLEAFVQQRWPQAQRLAFCLGSDRIVMRRGDVPLPDDCRPGPADRVWPL
ncbi:MAG: DUF2145 domain-containing protein [Rubrivivax sp.]|nr:DUF2145 domain-containing protein [Rubrivivax sp.]